MEEKTVTLKVTEKDAEVIKALDRWRDRGNYEMLRQIHRGVFCPSTSRRDTVRVEKGWRSL